MAAGCREGRLLAWTNGSVIDLVREENAFSTLFWVLNSACGCGVKTALFISKLPVFAGLFLSEGRSGSPSLLQTMGSGTAACVRSRTALRRSSAWCVMSERARPLGKCRHLIQTIMLTTYHVDFLPPIIFSVNITRVSSKSAR